MRKWQIHELGEPRDVLRLEEVDDPTPGPGQLLVEVDAVGLTYPDVLMCQGRYQGRTALPYTPGSELAGTVRAVGEGVDRFAAGDRVVAMGGGGLAELALTPAMSSFPLDPGLDVTKAVAIPVNYGTAWFALHERGHLQKGETLLVTGAAGGTGTAAIQLGKAAGARVIAVAGGKAKTEVCAEAGADVVIDHRAQPEWVEAVREATDGKGVDVAFDPVGGDTFHQVRRCMAWDGRLLVIGFVGGIADAPTNHILLKNYSVVGVHWGAWLARGSGGLQRPVGAVLELAAQGVVDPPIYPPFRFEQAADALTALADRAVWGKAVVRVHG